MVKQLDYERKFKQPFSSEWSNALDTVPPGDTDQEKKVRKYCDSFRLMWTISTQLNMEVYGAKNLS